MSICGFMHIDKSWIWYCLVVKGNRCFEVPLIWPLYIIIFKYWKYNAVRRLSKLRSLLEKDKYMRS